MSIEIYKKKVRFTIQNSIVKVEVSHKTVSRCWA